MSVRSVLRPRLRMIVAFALGGLLFGAPLGCDRSATSLFAPLATGLVRGLVTSVDGARPPQVTLMLTQGTTTLEAITDAGGVYAFPAVASAVWTLELGPLPSNWKLADGQAGRRVVLVVTDEISREDFVLERVP